jgi:hypothetical protein
VLHLGTWHSLDRFPLAPPDTTFLMITDHETQRDLIDSYAGRGRWALTQEVDLEVEYGVAVALAPRTASGNPHAAPGAAIALQTLVKPFTKRGVSDESQHTRTRGGAT